MIAERLARKLKQARVQSDAADTDFQALSSSVGSEQLRQWESEEEAAQAGRDTDVTTMDIFDVKDTEGTLESVRMLLNLRMVKRPGKLSSSILGLDAKVYPLYII